MRKLNDGNGGQVISVELVTESVTDPLGAHDALAGEAHEHLADAFLRVACEDAVELARGEAHLMLRQQGEDVPVERGSDCGQGTVQLHSVSSAPRVGSVVLTIVHVSVL